MKKENLFEIIRNEKGDIVLQLIDTNMTAYLSPKTCKEIIRQWKLRSATDNEIDKTALLKKNKVIKILEEATE